MPLFVYKQWFSEKKHSELRSVEYIEMVRPLKNGQLYGDKIKKNILRWFLSRFTGTICNQCIEYLSYQVVIAVS